MSNRIFNCTTCNDNSPITFVADDSLIPLYEGIQSNYIIGLNSVGSMDESFVYGAGFIDVVDTITIQSDGKILVGGEITSYDGMSSNKIIRLNLILQARLFTLNLFLNNILNHLFGNAVLGAACSSMFVTIMYASGIGDWLIFNETSSNKEMCYQPNEQTFKCSVYKDGTLVGTV